MRASRMIRRGLLAGAALSAALAPAAQARPSIVVQAAATSVHMVEVMNVTYQCSAAELGGRPVYLRRCSFGPMSASAEGCFECINPPFVFASDSGNVATGLPYELCVTAVSYLPSGAQTVSKCAPFNYATNSAVIAG